MRKTTTSVYLAAAAVERGHDPVLLVDADRQASVAEWLEARPVDGVSVVEAPSERTLTRAISRRNGLAIVDTPPGDQQLLESAVALADMVVIPTRAGGVEYSPAPLTLEEVPSRTRRGIVICAARLGTNDLEETIAWWRRQRVPIQPPSGWMPPNSLSLNRSFRFPARAGRPECCATFATAETSLSRVST